MLWTDNSPTCRCQFPEPATFECLWRALGCRLSHWRCCSYRSWGTEWESGLQVPQPHRYGKTISWLHIKKKDIYYLTAVETHILYSATAHVSKLKYDTETETQSARQTHYSFISLTFILLQHSPLLHFHINKTQLYRYEENYYILGRQAPNLELLIWGATIITFTSAAGDVVTGSQVTNISPHFPCNPMCRW